MYTTVLIIHSWIRWVALVAGFGATLGAVAGNDARTDRWGLVMMMTLDLQMLLGLMLYLVLSPFTAEAFKNFPAAMQNPQLRFWAVEHISMMFVAVVLAHVGKVLARKARTPTARRTRSLVCFGLATLAMLAAIPWPGLANGRPLFRI